MTNIKDKTKKELESFTLKEFGVNLDLRKNKKTLLKEIEKLQNKETVIIPEIVEDNFKSATRYRVLSSSHYMNGQKYIKGDIIVTNIDLISKFKNKFEEVK